MFGDIFGCHSCGVGVRKSACNAQDRPIPQTKNYPMQNVSNAEVSKPQHYYIKYLESSLFRTQLIT